MRGGLGLVASVAGLLGVTLQLGYSPGAHALEANARKAIALPESRAELAAAGLAAKAVHADLLERQRAVREIAADVLLLDLELYGHRELDRVHELCQEGRKVIVFSVLDAGAAAFLAKHESGDYCVEVIKDVAAGRLTVTPSMAGAMHADDRRSSRPTSARRCCCGSSRCRRPRGPSGWGSPSRRCVRTSCGPAPSTPPWAGTPRPRTRCWPAPSKTG
nr:hypothetical protein [Herbidospora cretacea]